MKTAFKIGSAFAILLVVVGCGGGGGGGSDENSSTSKSLPKTNVTLTAETDHSVTMVVEASIDKGNVTGFVRDGVDVDISTTAVEAVMLSSACEGWPVNGGLGYLGTAEIVGSVFRIRFSGLSQADSGMPTLKVGGKVNNFLNMSAERSVFSAANLKLETNGVIHWWQGTDSGLVCTDRGLNNGQPRSYLTLVKEANNTVSMFLDVPIVEGKVIGFVQNGIDVEIIPANIQKQHWDSYCEGWLNEGGAGRMGSAEIVGDTYKIHVAGLSLGDSGMPALTVNGKNNLFLNLDPKKIVVSGTGVNFEVDGVIHYWIGSDRSLACIKR